MRIKELFEDFQWDRDPDQDMENPLPLIKDDYAFNLMDSVDTALVSMVPGHEKLSGGNYGATVIKAREQAGTEQDVPIKQMVSTEKYLVSDQIKALMQGRARSSSKLPLLYKDGDTYYIGDGNHRIAADFLNKRPTTRALVLDANKILSQRKTQ